MAAGGSSWSAMDPSFETQNGAVDRLKKLYPAVNEEKSPLPRAWSAKEKYNYIGLSQNNLRVHYKGTPAEKYQPQFEGIPTKRVLLCKLSS
ncbi:ran-binding protein 10-like [Photinus pyralis]|uniref:ran-binding protein 10-like n=1 Tax=Photinus pyralis TaxID=7054 RepID=UPI0012671474|nr:ran-binding protein 10-like [Photinus pyralis]